MTTKPFYYDHGERDYELYVDGKLIMSGHQADVREKIEDLIESITNIRVSLQEASDEGYFQVYMHSDNDELTDEDYDKLDTFDFVGTVGDDEQTLAIMKLCNITSIKEISYE